MSNLEILILTECILAMFLALVVLIMAALIKKYKLKRVEVVKEVEKAPVVREYRYKLYDPDGFSVPITKEELALIDAQAKTYFANQPHKGGHHPIR